MLSRHDLTVSHMLLLGYLTELLCDERGGAVFGEFTHVNQDNGQGWDEGWVECMVQFGDGSILCAQLADTSLQEDGFVLLLHGDEVVAYSAAGPQGDALVWVEREWAFEPVIECDLGEYMVFNSQYSAESALDAFGGVAVVSLAATGFLAKERYVIVSSTDEICSLNRAGHFMGPPRASLFDGPFGEAMGAVINALETRVRACG